MAELQVFQNDQQSSDYILEKVELNHVGRFIDPVDIRTLVSAIEIYENLDKPYLSGNIILTDFSKVYNRADLQGAENLAIAFKRSKNGPVYEKMFIIDLVETKKLNDNTETIMLHLTEEVAFKSNLYNVNRSYRGKPSSIISNIASQFLNKVVNLIGENNYQGEMNVIIPNMNPLESMIWIKNRATDKEGYPYFLFSTLADDELYLTNLSDILSAPSINKKNPFFYGQSSAVSENAKRFMVIHDYRHKNAENMVRLIKKGLIGGTHHYYNTNEAQDIAVNFNIHNDLQESISLKNDEQSEMNVANDFTFDDVKLQDHNAREIFHISSSGAYSIGQGNYNSYDEEESQGGHKKKLIASALKNLLSKSTIEIRVSGTEFINSTESVPVHYTVGNSISLMFMSNINSSLQSQKIDSKKSGDYVIFQAKHTFVGERHDLTLLCAKVANLNTDEYSTGVVA